MLGAGSVIAGKYRLESPIGKGGMGAVWRATHLTLGRAVAVKLVLGDAPPAETLQRFLREARSLASVRHRNVVDVIDFGSMGADQGGRPFLAMECLEGESLAQRLERAPAPTLAEVAQWTSGALGGLAAIHDAGLVHRDLKPANIFLARDADGVIPKVLDFGIARSSEAEGATITHSMQTLGTPHYMSPEQVRSAKTVDARSDVYAMGVILYQALTGRLPFDGPSATAVIAAIVTDEPEHVAALRPDLPRAVAELVHRAMARDPAQRFPDARAMREALAHAVAGGAAALDGGKKLAPGAALDVASAATVPAVSLHAALGVSRPSGGVGFASEPRRKTGRRGFFALLGMLSTVLAVGVTGAVTMSTQTASETLPATAATRGGASAGLPAAPVPADPVPTPVPAVPAVPAASTRSGTVGEARFVSTVAPLSELALRVRELSPERRSCVRVTPRGTGWAAFAIASCEAHATALRTMLGGAGGDEGSENGGVPDATQRAAALEPVLLRTTTRANVRDAPGPERALRSTLPEETLLVGLYGDVGALRSEPGGRGTWTRAVAADGAEGWVASGLLRPWERCVPRASELGGTDVIVAWTRLDEPGAGVADALLLLQPSSGRLRLARTDATCAALEPWRVSTGGEAIEDVFVTRTAAEGGRTLLVIGVRERGPRDAEGLLRWSVHPLGAREAAWTIDLRSGQDLPDARREQIAGPYSDGEGGTPGFWPLRVRRLGGERVWYRWEGDTLVPDAGNGSR